MKINLKVKTKSQKLMSKTLSNTNFLLMPHIKNIIEGNNQENSTQSY